MSNRIKIKPITAKLSFETQTYSKMDPYVKIIYNKIDEISNVATNQHLTPFWKDEFEFELNSENPFIFFQIWDKNFLFKDSLIGTACINVRQFQAKNTLQWIPVIHDGINIGNFLFEMEYLDDMYLG